MVLFQSKYLNLKINLKKLIEKIRKITERRTMTGARGFRVPLRASHHDAPTGRLDGSGWGIPCLVGPLEVPIGWGSKYLQTQLDVTLGIAPAPLPGNGC